MKPGFGTSQAQKKRQGNALKKILEFSFLRSKLALNFETDVYPGKGNPQFLKVLYT